MHRLLQSCMSSSHELQHAEIISVSSASCSKSKASLITPLLILVDDKNMQATSQSCSELAANMQIWPKKTTARRSNYLSHKRGGGDRGVALCSKTSRCLEDPSGTPESCRALPLYMWSSTWLKQEWGSILPSMDVASDDDAQAREGPCQHPTAELAAGGTHLWDSRHDRQVIACSIISSSIAELKVV